MSDHDPDRLERDDGRSIVAPRRKGWLWKYGFRVGVGAILIFVLVMAIYTPAPKQGSKEPAKPPEMIAQKAVFPVGAIQREIAPVVPEPPADWRQQAAVIGKNAAESVGLGTPARRMLTYSKPPRTEHSAGPGEAAASKVPEHTGVAFKATTLPGVKAGAAMDETFIMRPGIIRCTLTVAIDSTQPGPFFCTTPEAVKSRKNVILMEANTQITGTYSGSVQQGQARMAAVSATAITPNGVPVALTAPIGDGLGRAGLTGEVDTHFGARFGGALMIMAAQGTISILQSAMAKGNSNNINLNTGAVESTVTEVLRNTINIPPTINVQQGSVIGIMVPYPVDFSDAYELRAAR